MANEKPAAPGGDLRGSSIIREIKASNIEFVVSVPDITTSEGLLATSARATRSATACALSSRSSMPWAWLLRDRGRGRRGQDRARHRRRLCELASRRPADRAEADRVMIKANDCLRILARHVADQDIVAPVYSAASTGFRSGRIRSTIWRMARWALRPRTRSDWRSGGRIVIDGDGSLLMNLGSLVSIAEVPPRNLIHFVCETGPTRRTAGIRSRTAAGSILPASRNRRDMQRPYVFRTEDVRTTGRRRAGERRSYARDIEGHVERAAEARLLPAAWPGDSRRHQSGPAGAPSAGTAYQPYPVSSARGCSPRKIDDS
jgi:hypothetical protein